RHTTGLDRCRVRRLARPAVASGRRGGLSRRSRRRRCRHGGGGDDSARRGPSRRPDLLAETMLARWLCAACEVEAPAGALTIGPVEPEDRLDVAEGVVSGHAGYIPWGREAAAVVLIAGNTLVVVAQGATNSTP